MKIKLITQKAICRCDSMTCCCLLCSKSVRQHSYAARNTTTFRYNQSIAALRNMQFELLSLSFSIALSLSLTFSIRIEFVCECKACKAFRANMCIGHTGVRARSPSNAIWFAYLPLSIIVKDSFNNIYLIVHTAYTLHAPYDCLSCRSRKTAARIVIMRSEKSPERRCAIRR